jgi:hypothetical protein
MDLAKKPLPKLGQPIAHLQKIYFATVAMPTA